MPANALRIVEDDTAADDDSRLSVVDLVRMFEESEDASLEARRKAEIDRDYADNKQYTAAEIATLQKRGQPIVTDNRIKSKIDFLVGLEKQQRIAPKAMPRTPVHEEDADGATQALRYQCDANRWNAKRSGVWRNLLVEGAGGIRVYAEPSRKSYGGQYGQPAMMASTSLTQGKQEYDIKISKVAWDRMFWDPHSSEPDFSDAGYHGLVVWMDYADALIKYPDGRDALDITMSSVTHSDTYDDKPKFTVWADRKRKRVRICQIWIRRDEEWYFAEYTKGGILKAGPSPYKTDTGQSDCELFFQSAFVDRDNNRFGYVREMISLQDEVNKRRSKTLHALNTKQVFFMKGAFDDVEKARQQIARPDGTIEVNPVAGPKVEDNVHIVENTQITEGNFKLLVEAQNAIDLKGPNATMLGDKAQGSAAASGKAIIASQQGGQIALGDLADNLKDLDLRVFTAVWNRIRQFWTAEKWLRTTDDEKNVKWVAMNVPRQQLMMLMQQNPEAAQKIAGSVGNVAELECDIIIDEGPDNITPQLEQFQAIVEMKKGDVNNEIPMRAVIESMPNYRAKTKIIEAMDKAEQARAEQGPPPDPEMVKAQTQAQIAQQKQVSDAQLASQKMQIDSLLAEKKQDTDAALAHQKQQNDAALAQQKAEADIAIAEFKATNEIRLKTAIASHDAELKTQQADHQARIDADKADREEAIQTRKADTEHAIKVRQSDADEAIKARSADSDEKIAARKADREDKAAKQKMDQEAKAKEPERRIESDLTKAVTALTAVVKDLNADTEVVRDPETDKVIGSRKVRK